MGSVARVDVKIRFTENRFLVREPLNSENDSPDAAVFQQFMAMPKCLPA